MTREGRRIGRPPNSPEEGKRVSLGLKVTADVKRLIDAEARRNGTTQSQEAERLIERALQTDRLLRAVVQASEEEEKRSGKVKVRASSGDGTPMAVLAPGQVAKAMWAL